MIYYLYAKLNQFETNELLFKNRVFYIHKFYYSLSTLFLICNKFLNIHGIIIINYNNLIEKYILFNLSKLIINK